MVVQIQAGERRHKDTVDFSVINAFGEHWIERMNAFKNQNIGRAELERNAFAFPSLGLKVEHGKLDLFAFQQFSHLLLDEGHIERADMLEVIGAVRLLGHKIAVEIIIVQTDPVRSVPMHPELNGEPSGKGGFS